MMLVQVKQVILSNLYQMTNDPHFHTAEVCRAENYKKRSTSLNTAAASEQSKTLLVHVKPWLGGLMRRIYGVTRTDKDDDDDDNDDIQSKLAASKSPKLQPDISSPDNS
ncbi:hypothetical protein OS493_009294 [Desmophyllum pertusum]|uniref:Uncharacterized protein n=1 Tax=Desmophyllum pertusum TaxID=174260 RepID=A0A9W9Z2G1_9CNID|nr:hypothetical protein OS493_009294 [Desmophyllum pertusum]